MAFADNLTLETEPFVRLDVGRWSRDTATPELPNQLWIDFSNTTEYRRFVVKRFFHVAPPASSGFKEDRIAQVHTVIQYPNQYNVTASTLLALEKQVHAMILPPGNIEKILRGER